MNCDNDGCTEIPTTEVMWDSGKVENLCPEHAQARQSWYRKQVSIQGLEDG